MRSKLSGRLRAGWFMAASAAALALVLVPAAQAATNVVPNPGFETAGCGTTLIICNWAATSGGAITQDSTNPHSGAFSMHITSSSGNNAAAVTGNGFCTALAAGVHQSSFFYRTTDIDFFAVALHATFWTNASCTSFASDVVAAFQAPTKDGQWHQATGTFTVPAGNFVTFALV